MIANLLIAIVIAIHVFIVIVEMALWDKPLGLKAFNLTPEFAARTKVMAANQGLYNAFLVAGLVYGLAQGSAGLDFKIFFLACVLVAGIFGAMTSSVKILFVQSVPAALALAALLAGL